MSQCLCVLWQAGWLVLELVRLVRGQTWLLAAPGLVVKVDSSGSLNSQAGNGEISPFHCDKYLHLSQAFLCLIIAPKLFWGDFIWLSAVSKGRLARGISHQCKGTRVQVDMAGEPAHSGQLEFKLWVWESISVSPV